VVIATLAFGFTGLWKYDGVSGHRPEVGSVFYHTLQLFILHAPHLEAPVPWQLHLGRILGAGVFFVLIAGIVRTILVYTHKEWLLIQRLRGPWTRGHVVICGLGDLGLRLALEGRRRKKPIVAIERFLDPAARELARKNGILVLEGDACDPRQLRAAQVARAEFVVAACPDDDTNVAIAATVNQVVSSDARRTSSLVCRLLVKNPRTRTLLAQHAILPRSARIRVNFRDLDQHAIAARQVFRQNPLDFEPIRENDDTLVHLIVIGYGDVGQSLASHAAHIGHFANEVGRGKRLRITVADPSGNSLKEFRARYPSLNLVCDLKPWTKDPTDPNFVAALEKLSPDGGKTVELVTYAVCLEGTEGEEANFRVGVELAARVKGRRAQILVHQRSCCGFATVLAAPPAGAQEMGRIHPFGMIEEVFTWDVLLHEEDDEVARALHDDYHSRHPDKPWEQLSEELRDSNRHAADHIPIKLRALGYHEEPLRKDKDKDTARITSFTPDQVLLLSKMEHARWCAERWLAGWKYGPETIREKKINKHLRPWNKLTPEQQKKDHEQIEAIPNALLRVDKGIYR
jgi:voltage-gated potassium channel Kch